MFPPSDRFGPKLTTRSGRDSRFFATAASKRPNSASQFWLSPVALTPDRFFPRESRIGTRFRVPTGFPSSASPSASGLPRSVRFEFLPSVGGPSHNHSLHGNTRTHLGRRDARSRRPEQPDERFITGPLRLVQRPLPPLARTQDRGHQSPRATLQAMSDAELAGQTAEFRRRLAAGETLDDILVEAFAVCREGGRRFLGMRHYDVQLIAAWCSTRARSPR